MRKPAAQDRPVLTIESAAALRGWLAANHDTSRGVWLATYKKRFADKHVPISAVIDEALCFGWIDSVTRAVDDERSSVLLTPRKTGSAWSRVNKEKVARLEAEGRIAPPGQAKIDAAKADGSWSFLDDVEDLIQPDDLKAALAAAPGAAAAFDGFPRSSKRATLEWIKQAKTAATRAKRIAETARLAALGQRVR